MGVDFRTQAIHAGYEPLDNGRAAVPPIYASAALDLGDAARGDALAGGDGIGAVAVGSGMAAAY